MKLKNALKFFMPLCLALGCMLMFDSCTEETLEECTGGCGEFGTCDTDTGACICEAGYFGANCEQIDACYLVDCGENQSCDSITGECGCDEGWYGQDCTSNNPCDEVDLAPCPENAMDEVLPLLNDLNEVVFNEAGDTTFYCGCDCIEGYAPNDEGGCDLVAVPITIDDYIGIYTQRDIGCMDSDGNLVAGSDGEGNYNYGIGTVEISADPLVANGVILDGFSIINDLGFTIKAVLVDLQGDGNYNNFEFSPNPQTALNAENEGVVFTSYNLGSYDNTITDPQGNPFVRLSIDYSLESGAFERCIVTLDKL